MIALNDFLRCVQENASRIRGYALGGDGENGESDCIGLIIGALGLAGCAWPGVHGTNWAARNAVRGLDAVSSVSQLALGNVVFKARAPGDAGYDLPSLYRTDPDRNDYYHVGVVTSLSPLSITHCTSVPGGIQTDSALGAWRFAGKLDMVGSPVLYEAAVTAANGKPVNLRRGPDVKTPALLRAETGQKVQVLEETGPEWAFVSIHGQTGYMMRCFLSRQEQEGGVLLSRRDHAQLLSLWRQMGEILEKTEERKQ